MSIEHAPRPTIEAKSGQQDWSGTYDFIERIRSKIGEVVVGQNVVDERLLIALFTGGHVLLQGVPGLAKTLLVKTIADVLDLSFKRIQFTPDLMPSDIIGSEVMNESRQFYFNKGPVFANIVLHRC